MAWYLGKLHIIRWQNNGMDILNGYQRTGKVQEDHGWVTSLEKWGSGQKLLLWVEAIGWNGVESASQMRSLQARYLNNNMRQLV